MGVGVLACQLICLVAVGVTGETWVAWREHRDPKPYGMEPRVWLSLPPRIGSWRFRPKGGGSLHNSSSLAFFL